MSSAVSSEVRLLSRDDTRAMERYGGRLPHSMPQVSTVDCCDRLWRVLETSNDPNSHCSSASSAAV